MKKKNVKLFEEIVLILLSTFSADEYEYSSTLVKHTKSTSLSNKQMWF